MKTPENQNNFDNLEPKFDESIFTHQPVPLNMENISEHINSLTNESFALPHKEILARLIEKIELVDFQKLSGMDDYKKIKNDHYQIIVIEQILFLAATNNWGICKNNCFVYLFNGAYWSLLGAEELKAFLGEAAEQMGLNQFKARYFSFRDNLYKQFMATAYLQKQELPVGKVIINLKNGTFEITPQGNILREFRRKDFLTYQLPFEYDVSAKAPRFQRFLDVVLPDKSLQLVLAEYLGYVFIHPRILNLEKALLLFGDGANGKSVIFDIVIALFGSENISNFSLQSLTDSSGYYRAMLANKLANYGSEINGNLDASIFKQITSGEPLGVRLPFMNPFILENYAKLIFNCNNLPRDVEHTNAYFRRFLIIPFKVTIPEDKQDKELAKKIIKTELSGIFNWVLDGLNRLLEQKKFSESKAIKEQVEEYKKQTDSVKMFLDENDYVSDASDYKLIKDLYIDYRLFCTADGFKPVNKINFKKRLINFGIIAEKRNVGFVAFLSNEKI